MFFSISALLASNDKTVTAQRVANFYSKYDRSQSTLKWKNVFFAIPTHIPTCIHHWGIGIMNAGQDPVEGIFLALGLIV